MTFLEPSALLAGAATALLVVLAWWEHARRRRRLAVFLGGVRATRRLSRHDLYRPRVERLLLLGLATMAVAAAAAEPRWGQDDRPAPVSSVVLAIDVSASMQATDVVPTRLASAVEIAGRLVDGLPDARIGLLLYAGDSYPLASPTRDHAAIRYFLSGVTPTMASAHDPGSLPSVGIRAASALWRTPVAPGEERTIVLIGDGEAGEPAGEVLEAVRAAAERGIRVSAIGVGSVQGSGIVMPAAPYQIGGPVVDATGTPAISRLDAPALEGLVEVGRGRYAAGDDERAVAALREWLGANRVDAPWWVRYDVPYLLALAALAALLVESLLDVRMPGWHAARSRRTV
jgi:Ca-activated chloride channel family protein